MLDTYKPLRKDPAPKEIAKKPESKYVSVFADAQPDVNITFRDHSLLRDSAAHYKVGIDNYGLYERALHDRRY